MTPRVLLPAAAAVAIITLVASAAGAATGDTIPGPAGPDVPTAAVIVTAVTPAVPEPGETLVVEGTVTNTTDTPMYEVQALFRHNLNPVSNRAEIGELDTDPRRFWGYRPGHIFDEVTSVLAPGSTAGFRLEMTVDTACPTPVPGGLPCVQIQHPGVYVIGVDVREGDANVPLARVDAGTTLTLLPWLIETIEADPVQVALLWPLQPTPAMLADPAADNAPQVRATMDAAGDAPVTWLVDASLPASVGRDISPESEVWMLPYGSPDLAAFEGIDQPGTGVAMPAQLATDAISGADTAAALLPAAHSGIAWPNGGGASPAMLDTLADAGVTTVVLSDATVDGLRHSARVQLPAHGLAAVVTDSGLDTIVAARTESDVYLRQRWLAETALAAMDGQAALVTGPAPGMDGDPELPAAVLEIWTTTPWSEAVALSTIDDPFPPVAATATDTDQVLLPPANVAATVDLLASADQYTMLVGDDLDAEQSAWVDTVALRSASSAWHDDPAAGVAFTEAVTDHFTDQLAEVDIQVAPAVTLSSNTGAFPVNVVNGLDVPVTVRLEPTSANPDRMAVEPISEQRVEAGETEIVRVTAEATANGRVPVEIQLATTDGVPLGSPRTTVVNATEYGIIGWFLIAGATALFVVGLAIRTVRGRRRNGQGSPTDAESFHLDEVAR